VGAGDDKSQGLDHEQMATDTEPSFTDTLSVEEAAKVKSSLFTAAGNASTSVAAVASQIDSTSEPGFASVELLVVVATCTADATSLASSLATCTEELLDAQSSEPAAPEIS